ncbi:FAS1-like dehydratase domain-containing protein [Halorientalis halophila]|uniref:FAS1-like dehydratase domain-containing protein n=1 Tax=Halorientalis halophila TaxID=3108499 RepID=UPI00300ADFA6
MADFSHLDGLVGETRRTVEGLEVEAGKVAEFATALRDDNPIHHDPAAATEQGFDAVPAPLTFTRTSYFPRYRPEGISGIQGFDLGFDEQYTVHGEQAYEYERPLVVGDVLTGDTTVLDAFERDGQRGGTMTFAILETVFRDADDEPVVTAQSTVIETGGAIDDGEDGDGEETTCADAEADADGEAPIPNGDGIQAGDRGEPRPTAADVAVGDPAPPVVVEDLERKDFVKYAGASGDFTPIHYDEPFVREAGHDSVFAQGMLTAGYAARAVADWFGLENVTQFSTRFRSQLFPGESVVVTGEIDEVSPTDEGATVHATVEATTRDGTVLLTGQAEATVPAE